MAKINLKLLKDLVKALEDNVDSSEESFKNNKDVNTHIIELSKNIGLCMTIAQESNLLINDLKSLITVHQAASNMDFSKDDVVALFNNLKKSPGSEPGSGNLN